jgi:glycogen operon protein
LIRLRKAMPELRQTKFLHGHPIGESELENVVWLKPDAAPMTPDDWRNGHTRAIGLLLCDASMACTLILMNAHHEAVPFRLPDRQARAWHIVVDTAEGRIEPDVPAQPAGEMFHLQGRSLYLLTTRK